MNHEALTAFWNRFAAVEPDSDVSQRPYKAEQFGDTRAMADTIGPLIVAGKKTATCSALWEYDAENEPLPMPGKRIIVVDGSGNPLCIIETTAVEIRAYDDIDAEFAWEEGEDDRTLESWRREHWKFFSRTLPLINHVPTSDMPLVCERFRVLYVE